MIKSICSYFRMSKLSKVLQECRRRQYTSQVDAMHECNRLFRNTGKDYWVIKHQKEELFCVVHTDSAKVLHQLGHIILTPYHGSTLNPNLPKDKHKGTVSKKASGLNEQDYSKWISDYSTSA